MKTRYNPNALKNRLLFCSRLCYTYFVAKVQACCFYGSKRPLFPAVGSVFCAIIFLKQSGIFLPQSLQSSRRRSVGCALAKAPALVRESVHEVKGVPESRQTAAKICFFVFCFQLSFAMIPVKMPSFLKKEQYL